MANATGRPTAPLVLSLDERDYLERQVRRHRVARSMSERCRIILRCSDGLPSKVVAVELGVHEHTVGKWRRRFLKERIEGLLDEARPGRPRTIDDDQVAAVIERTLRSTPADATHWSIRSMAGVMGFSHTTIRRIWTAFGLQPHRSETFKLSSDPLFVDKVRDIVGLYLSPPNRALVLSVDEKSQIQALDREQPVLPMMPGVPERGPTPMSVMAQPRCSQRSTSPPALLSANATSDIGPPNSLISSNRSTLRSPGISTSTSSWTTTPPTKRQPSGHGWPDGRAITCISPQHQPPGSIRSNAGSPSSPARSCAAASTPRPASSRLTSAPSSNCITRTPNLTSGPSLPTRSFLSQALRQKAGQTSDEQIRKAFVADPTQRPNDHRH